MKVETIGDLVWSFSSKEPYVLCGDRSHTVDPMPCYSHDQSLVEAEVANIEKVLPIEDAFAPNWFILKYEAIERVNAWTDRLWNWDPDYKGPKNLRPWSSQIVLIGKRTPIHPAITRHLVAHEYGHVIHYWLQRKWDVSPDVRTSEDEIFKQYAKIRGIDISRNPYGPGNWHSDIGEIFADDFRLCLAEKEKEFWPHDVERPENLPQVLKWWQDQRLWAFR